MFLSAGWCLSWLALIGAAGAVAPLYSGSNLALALPAAERAAPFYSVGLTINP